MREFKIAVANSRKAGTWRNITQTWPNLQDRLKTTVYTAETSEEYWAMTKDERDAAKDKGGFVGGYLKNGRRRITDVQVRSLITHDVDDPEPDFRERFLRECKYAAILYTTHSHMPDKPRYRVVIALAEDITPDRYVAVSRYLAAEFGIEQYDPVSFVTNQLMHWPSTSKDGEYLCEVVDGPFLDADAYLAEHPGWEDFSNLPTNSRERKLRSPDGKHQEDPTKKDGVVGAFCRTYGIHGVIDKWLSNVYAATDVEDRFDYIPGEGSNGAVVYDDLFLWSHHATDPASGHARNAFDLVRVHRFKDDDEKSSFLKMCEFAENDPLVKATMEKEQLEKAQKDFEEITSNWEEPIPFGRYVVEPFPIDALPPDLGDYVRAVAESTQTPPDMAGSNVLSAASFAQQGKYETQGKADWKEPHNLFVADVAEPSARKSAVLGACIRPADQYETQYNLRNAAAFESSKMSRRILERRQKALEDKIAKGNGEPGEMEALAQEIADFVELTPLQLYVDDVTPEKLVSIMAANHGRAAIISSEGGIFDTLAGIYTKNVNIDVMLKGYSGDTIRVDRIGRESETIMDPTLTIFLMVQPKVISAVLSNATFRGRGLTARFLYSMPRSTVGDRRYESEPVPEEVYQRYERKIINMLEDEYPMQPEVITLSPGAAGLLRDFAEELEPKMKGEYAEIADWVGKLVGNTLRMAGILCRAGVYRSHGMLEEGETGPLVVSEETMANAIRLGRYFLSHALAVFDVIPENEMYKQADRILKMVREKSLSEFDRRLAMRNCRTFKTVSEIQPVLDFLEDYGYILRMPEKPTSTGRPPLPRYVVNPHVLS